MKDHNLFLSLKKKLGLSIVLVSIEKLNIEDNRTKTMKKSTLQRTDQNTNGPKWVLQLGKLS
jgi:hypothetical protein